ncbi:unnamed protein product [Adineta ricciae]|uniref:LisH domain-containing protein n=1 Tax=Adineta ricciae TaxID=249248 RepID=A0A814HU24_ADIRI|nr:unnamed protein product [Adineta ricciae]
MTSVDQNGLSGRDLRIKLFDLMKSKGIVDNVKVRSENVSLNFFSHNQSSEFQSHLRGRLIQELRGGVDDQIRFSSSETQPTLLVRALNALILDYFQVQKYDYTSSVFIPDANINDYKVMSDEEILRLLNISTESTFYKKIKSNKENHAHTSLLMAMLTCIASWLPGSWQSNGTQTSHDLWSGSIAGATLDEKLSNLDAMYNNRQDDVTSMHNLSTEEKLLLFQKNIELRTKESLQQQMEQFRENEIKKIREDERLKCQMELQSLRKELEALYHSKHETLNEKEGRISDRFKAELENERRELYGQRQTFLEELKAMKMRETENQRNLEIRERSLTLEADRVKRLEDDIRKREVGLANTELHVDQQVQMKLNKLRFEVEQQFTERNKNLQLIEMRNQEETRRLAEERLAAEQAKAEVVSMRKHYSEADSKILRLQSEIKVLQNENEILREKSKQSVDYQSIREENAVLKSQMNNTTSRSQRSNRYQHDSDSSSPHERSHGSRGVIRELKTILDNQAVGQRVVNDELVDLKTQIALLQSSNEPEPYFNGRFPSNHGGDYLSRVVRSASDAQLNQSRYSTSSNYNQFIEEAKLRMHELDREADRVEESYRDYQHRILTQTSQPHALQLTEIDYSSARRGPTVKLSAQIQGASNPTTSIMPASTSLQDINSHTQKYNWNKDQPMINLTESLLTSKSNPSSRPKTFSQSNDHIFEHPEITIKPSRADDRASRRSLVTTKSVTHYQSNGGSVPNILEHPDMKTPIVMETQQQVSLSSSSASTPSSSHPNNRKIMRQQSADVYATMARTVSPANRDQYQTNAAPNQRRTDSSGSAIDNIMESPEQEKSEDSSSFSLPPPTTTTVATKAPVQIVREYSEVSSASDVDRTGKHSRNTNKPQSEEDDFW